MEKILHIFGRKKKNVRPSLKKQDAILSKNSFVKKYSTSMENINTIVFGCPDSGIKRSYLYPNMLQTNSSFVVMDYNRENYSAMKEFLEKNGYKVQILDTEQPSDSDGFNPLWYCKTAYDVENLVDCFELPTDDPFCAVVLKKLICACIAFMTLNAPGKTVPYCKLPEIVGEKFYMPSPTLDDLFFMLEMAFSKSNQNYWAFVDLFKKIKHYEWEFGEGHSYCLASWIDYYNCSNTVKVAISYQMKSVLDTLKKQDVAKIANNSNKISIETFGIEKTAVFVNISHIAQEQLYLVRMFLHQVYSVLFNFSDGMVGSKKMVLPNGELLKWISPKEAKDPNAISEIVKEYQDVAVESDQCKGVYNIYSSKRNKIMSFPSYTIAKRYVQAIENAKIQDCTSSFLPIPVRVFISNLDLIGEIPCLTHYMAIARGVNISTTIIAETVDEIKKAYKNNAEVILENCAYWLYMGASSPEKCEFLEERIKMISRQKGDKSLGLDSNYSSNNLFGLPVCKMAVLAVQKGEYWIDDKFVLEDHPYYKYFKTF